MKFIVRLLVTEVVAYGLSMILKPHIVIDSYSTALIFCTCFGNFERNYKTDFDPVDFANYHSYFRNISFYH
jgi:hypothetical protein